MKKLLIVVLALLMTVGMLASEPVEPGMVEIPHSWSGGASFTTEAFYTSGEWEITLRAQCFEGIGFVRVTAFDQDGEEVGEVTVIGEGVESAVLNTEPGGYYLEIHVSHFHIYQWEVVVEPVEAESTAEESQVSDVTRSETEVATAAAPLSGVVEIEMRTENGELFFDPVGVWVEPGTTIRFVLVSGVHDSQAYHPDNATELMRIPEGAEPWDSAILTEPGAAFEVTLTAEGVYDYFCAPHERLGMVGRIIVGDPEAAPTEPLEEIPFEKAREALPSVEEIMEQGVVNW